LFSAVLIFQATSSQWSAVHAQEQLTHPQFSHGMELKVRKADEADFSDTTQRHAIEVYTDSRNSNLVYISDAGSIAVIARPARSSESKRPPAPQWRYGLELKVRKAEETDFTAKTTRYGIEVYVDASNGNLIYISETGAIAVVSSASAGPPPAKILPPQWRHGLKIKARRAGEPDFTAKTQAYGAEAFIDGNSGQLIYICETGSIAVLPASGLAPRAATVSPPQWRHGLELKARTVGEYEFTNQTREFGLEAFFDANTQKLLLITQTGSLAALSGDVAKAENAPPPQWSHAFELKVRRAGEADFSDKTRRHAVEVFTDAITKATIAITGGGAISVLAIK
jgi:hypothetical protein